MSDTPITDEFRHRSPNFQLMTSVAKWWVLSAIEAIEKLEREVAALKAAKVGSGT